MKKQLFLMIIIVLAMHFEAQGSHRKSVEYNGPLDRETFYDENVAKERGEGAQLAQQVKSQIAESTEESEVISAKRNGIDFGDFISKLSWGISKLTHGDTDVTYKPDPILGAPKKSIKERNQKSWRLGVPTENLLSENQSFELNETEIGKNLSTAFNECYKAFKLRYKSVNDFNELHLKLINYVIAREYDKAKTLCSDTTKNNDVELNEILKRIQLYNQILVSNFKFNTLLAGIDVFLRFNIDKAPGVNITKTEGELVRLSTRDLSRESLDNPLYKLSALSIFPLDLGPIPLTEGYSRGTWGQVFMPKRSELRSINMPDVILANDRMRSELVRILYGEKGDINTYPEVLAKLIADFLIFKGYGEIVTKPGVASLPALPEPKPTIKDNEPQPKKVGDVVGIDVTGL